jgi:hypothetical protein
MQFDKTRHWIDVVNSRREAARHCRGDVFARAVVLHQFGHQIRIGEHVGQAVAVDFE